MITRPSQMPGVVRFDPLAYDVAEARAVIAEARAWAMVRWLELACATACATSFAVWAFLTF